VLADACELVIVEARAPDARLVELEAERMHEVQRRADVGAEPDHIARVRRYLGLEQDDVKHARDHRAARVPSGVRGGARG
jgi:hypothetical protein